MLSKLKPEIFVHIFKKSNSVLNCLLNYSLEAEGSSDNWLFGMKKGKNF